MEVPTSGNSTRNSTIKHQLEVTSGNSTIEHDVVGTALPPSDVQAKLFGETD